MSGVGLHIKESDSKIDLPWVAGQTWWFDTVTRALKVWDGAAWAFPSTVGAGPYDIGCTIVGVPPIGTVILRYPCPRAIDFPLDMALSRGVSEQVATAITTFSIRKNGTQFATMVFAASASVATFTGTATSFVAGDILTVVTPSPADLTLSGVGFGLVALKL